MSRVLKIASLLLVTALPLQSCAIIKEENRPVLEWMDETLSPEDATTRVALSPVILPVGVVGAVADAAFYRPATSFDDAWYDTERLLWDYEPESNFWDALYAPFAVVVTPVIYATSFTARVLFPVPSHEDGRDVEPVATEPGPGANEPATNEGGTPR